MRSELSTAVHLAKGPGGSAVLTLVGPLDVRTAADVRRDLTQRLAGARVASLDVDASGIERGDMSGMAILYELVQGRFTAGARVRLIGLRPELQKILAPFCPREPPSAEGEAPRRSILAAIGASVMDLAHHARAHGAFIGATAQAFVAGCRPPPGHALARGLAHLREGRRRRAADRLAARLMRRLLGLNRHPNKRR